MTPLIEITAFAITLTGPRGCNGKDCDAGFERGDTVIRIESDDETWDLCDSCAWNRSFSVVKGEGRRKCSSLPGDGPRRVA